jgi:hypothetical protein
MARAWESKSVESQMAEGGRLEDLHGPLSAADRELQQRRSKLELSRARALQELEATTSPIRRAALEDAIAFLEGELAKLAGAGSA